MKNGGIFGGLIDRYKHFLYGRYGQDGLNRFISCLAIALCIISFIVRSTYLTVAILILFALSLYRSFSKKFARRRQENQLYEKAAKPVKRYVKYWFIRIKTHKTHRVYTCRKCHSILRVPKSAPRDRIEIKCPKCGDKYLRIKGS